MVEMRDKRLGEWVRATWLGWVLGVPLTIAAALAGEAVGIREGQVLVGAGMGAGVGLVQRRVMRGLIANARSWVWSSAIGLAAPFLVFDLALVAGLRLPYSLYAAVALGGLAAGLWQAALLRPAFHHAWMWVFGSTVGWSLAAASAAVAERLPRALSLRGLGGAATYLALVLAGGLALGLVTGLLLVRLPRRDSAGVTMPVARA